MSMWFWLCFLSFRCYPIFLTLFLFYFYYYFFHVLEDVKCISIWGTFPHALLPWCPTRASSSPIPKRCAFFFCHYPFPSIHTYHLPLKFTPLVSFHYYEAFFFFLFFSSSYMYTHISNPKSCLMLIRKTYTKLYYTVVRDDVKVICHQQVVY